MTYEAGLQALDPRNFSGPVWEQLTGIKSNVVELSHPDQYSKPVAEHIADSGAYDILDIEPAWTPSLADGGVIAPLDDYIAKYMNKADLDDYHPLYKALPTYKGKHLGLLRRRRHVRALLPQGHLRGSEAEGRLPGQVQQGAARCRRPGRTMPRSPSSSPTRWRRTSMAPATSARPAAPATSIDFLQQFRANGGKFFDDDMKAQLARRTPASRRCSNMIAANKASIPGNNELDAVSLWAAWLQGKVAMIYSWPPTGPHDGGLFAERQGDQLHPAVDDRRQGRLRRRARRQSASTPPATTRRWRPTRPTPRPPICSCSGRPRRRSRSRA